MSNGQVIRVGKAPPEAQARGVQAGMERLMNNYQELQMVMIRNGDFEGAKQLEDFVNSRKSQTAMKEMNTALVAINWGDTDLFAESVKNMQQAYKDMTPWEVQTEGTRLLRNEAGQTIGATLQVRNRDTGDVMTQDYIGMQNVLDALTDFGLPHKQYERQQTRVGNAVKKRLKSIETFEEGVRELMTEMYPPDTWVERTSGQPVSEEEINRRIQHVGETLMQLRPDLAAAGVKPPRMGGAASGVGNQINGGSNNQPVPTMEGM
ncbi:hypothetical protein RAZWK3B_16640 [Roseobacter sp. AzwK-3b]|uniref:hypothetical protein n=1 Tax=Roseobacter sp. AzwK-3b TaxID=351016 RepID=UPI0001569880|nr:hypothetical protein [Roseobacter sp. AzwK-3b]EDM71043.1 hypothetical protein RAZWK3B_16640 [Roseobacter sp. AzwK-3b]